MHQQQMQQPMQQQQMQQPMQQAADGQAPRATQACGTDGRCSGHGRCADGRCSCEPGFSGATCATACAGLTEDGVFCNGAGACRDDGSCKCDTGFVGPTCALSCPGGPSAPCSGRGACSARAECACDKGWAGHACEREEAPPSLMAAALAGGWVGLLTDLPNGFEASASLRPHPRLLASAPPRGTAPGRAHP